MPVERFYDLAIMVLLLYFIKANLFLCEYPICTPGAEAVDGIDFAKRSQSHFVNLDA